MNINVYGALLNSGSRFFDARMGQSTTLTGRCIDKHMSAKSNEVITGIYDYKGDAVIYADTDSVDATSIIRIQQNGIMSDMTIEELFTVGTKLWKVGEKEYSVNNNISVLHYGSNSNLSYVNYNYVYRHKVSKKKYIIRTDNHKAVTVTEDHSVMVYENEQLIEKKPVDLSIGDSLITVMWVNQNMSYLISKIDSIDQLSDYSNEYVYDIGVSSNDPYFFANDILVHNSSYFSAYPMLKDDIESGNIKWDKDTAIEFYDAVSEEVNKSFPYYMRSYHNSPDEFNYTIAAGREVVGRTGIFITKKRYAILVYDTEGYREDQTTQHGKIKAMGLDLKRSDTPGFMQKFLKDILLDVLTGASQQSIIERIREFRKEFRELKPWEMGTPKRVNNLTAYYAKEYKKSKSGNEEFLGKATMPGHVRAAINYNRLRELNKDNFSLKIVDGMKTVVCKLKPNSLNMTSIAIPTDESRIPDWFKALPFDLEEMEDTIVDQKLMNLLGVLNWDITQSKMSEELANLFDFE